jgi:hypothetical protein
LGIDLEYGCSFPRIGYVGNGVVKQATGIYSEAVWPVAWMRDVVDATGDMDSQVSIVINRGTDERWFLYRDLNTSSMRSSSPCWPCEETAVTISSLVALPVPGGINLTWSAYLDGGATFRVERSGRSDCPYATLTEGNSARADETSFSYRDLTARPNTRYWYRLSYRQGSAGWTMAGTVLVTSPAASFALHPVTPNPVCNRNSIIRFELPSAAAVTVDVYDGMGRRVRTLYHGQAPAGLTATTWDGRDDRGSPLGSGVYFARLQQGGRQASQKFIVFR